MAVNYTLRDPNYSIPTEPEQRVAESVLVKPFVVLKDLRSGAQVVQVIRDFASLEFPDEQRFDQLCEGWGVTEDPHKKALKDLFNILKVEKRSLKLDDPAAEVPLDVNPPE